MFFTILMFQKSFQKVHHILAYFKLYQHFVEKESFFTLDGKSVLFIYFNTSLSELYFMTFVVFVFLYSSGKLF